MIVCDYECPNCDHDISTEIPDPGDYFDELVICPGCGELHFRLVSARGDVTTKMVIAGVPNVNDRTIKNIRKVK